MLLEKLILTDIGTYCGIQEFDLAPRMRYGATRPVILFGGLNGAGKTTFLSAIRLALYGRQALEGMTQKQYELHLRDLIHRPRESLLPPIKGIVTLELTHARLGEKTHYKVVRSFEMRGKDNVEEKISVFCNRESIASLIDEQAQAFLTQLIPAGVSQFFFFDGEKIASLAKDDSDVVLADSIRRLLGLDIAERLNSDLSVYLRQLRANRADAKTREEISRLQAELDQLESEVADGQARLERIINPTLDDAKRNYERKREELMDRGGAWAVDRNALEIELQKARAQRVEVESQLREQLNGLAVFCVAPRLASKVVSSLKLSQELSERELLANSLRAQLKDLKTRVGAVSQLRTHVTEIVSCIDDWADEFIKPIAVPAQFVAHGLSQSELRTAIDALTWQSEREGRGVSTSYKQADALAKKQEEIQDRLATAPSDESLTDAVAALTKAAESVGQLASERRAFIEELRRKTWTSIGLVRRLKKLESRVVEEGEAATGEQAAMSLQAMIEEFKVAAAIEKCETLRRHFIGAFHRLARKDDIVHDVKIDPRDFRVELFDRSGRVLPKKRLSAGEKQIYAIAMLEALGKTSRRNLPVIIDTPLGRLDSKHRNKLVESYFPVASHQVIVLSTDTEVDLPFYEGLQKHISHAYHLSFDQITGATKVEDGYFWRRSREDTHAA